MTAVLIKTYTNFLTQKFSKTQKNSFLLYLCICVCVYACVSLFKLNKSPIT